MTSHFKTWKLFWLINRKPIWQGCWQIRGRVEREWRAGHTRLHFPSLKCMGSTPSLQIQKPVQMSSLYFHAAYPISKRLVHRLGCQKQERPRIEEDGGVGHSSIHEATPSSRSLKTFEKALTTGRKISYVMLLKVLHLFWSGVGPSVILALALTLLPPHVWQQVRSWLRMMIALGRLLKTSNPPPSSDRRDVKIHNKPAYLHQDWTYGHIQYTGPNYQHP